MPDEDIETTEEVSEPDGAGGDTEPEDDDKTYPAEIVRKLRKESANYRGRAKTAEARVEELGRALFTARVEATGKVASAAEIPYDADILDDPDAISQAVDDALAKRPYIKARRVSGDVGQGDRGKPTAPADFSLLLR